MAKLIMEEQAAPGTPAANTVVIYPKTDGKMYFKDDAGTEYSMADTGIDSGTAYQIAALGVNTAAGSTGTIRATGDITASYSDGRLKDRVGEIVDALSKVKSLTSFTYKANQLAQSYGFDGNKIQVGLNAQEVQAVLPEAVSLAPFDTHVDLTGKVISISGNEYLTLHYERIIALLVEAIKELDAKVEKHIVDGEK